jgi:hypothetical protein
MVMVVMMMMMRPGSEHRAGKYHQKQDSCKNLFHGLNVPRVRRKR